MILLTSAQALRVTTTAAVATDCYVSWSDVAAIGAGVVPGNKTTPITTATTTTIAAAPAASTYRKVRTVTVYNRHASTAQGVTLFVDGDTDVTLITVTLLAGEQLSYTDTQGWNVIDSQGRKKGIGQKGDKGDPGEGAGVVDAPAAGTFGATAAGPGQWLDAAASRSAIGAASSAALTSEASARADADTALGLRAAALEETAPTFSPILAFTSNKRFAPTSNNTAPLVLALSPTGEPVEGSTISIYIAPNQFTALRCPPEFGQLDPFVSSAPYRLIANYSAGAYTAIGRVISAPDAAAPELASAVVANDQRARVVATWDKAILAQATTGLTLDVTTGAPVTIAGIVSSPGDETATLQLSRDLIVGDVVSLNVGAGRVVQSLSGPRVAVESFPVTLDFAAPYDLPGAFAHYRGDVMPTSGSNVLSVTDQEGVFGNLIKGGAGTVTTVGVGGKTWWKTSATGYLKADKGSSQVIASGAILVKFRLVSTAGAQAIVATGLNGSPTAQGLTVLLASGLVYLRRASNNGSTGDAADMNGANTAAHDAVITWRNTGTTRADMFIDGLCVAASIDAVTVDAISRLALGVWPDLSSIPGEIEYGELWMGSSWLAGADGDGNDALGKAPVADSDAAKACNYLDGSDGGYWA